MKKFFKPLGVGSATALISITSLLSYAIGLFRDRIIAVNFGTTNATDTYNASFLIPDILFNLFIAGALSAAFLPIFTEYLVKDKKEAYKIANTMLTSAVVLIGLLALIAFIFMPKLIPLLFSTAPIESQIDIIKMTRLMLGSAILFAISNTLGNILMSFKHFIAYSLSPILYNLGIILGITFLHDKLGIYSAATGVLIGASLHCIVRIIDVFSTGYKYKPQLQLKHPAFRKILKLMIPKSVSLIAWQINLYVFAIIGMKVLEGGLSAFHFARNIQSFAVSLFGIAFATAVFPFISAAISKGDNEKFTHHIQKTIQRILFFTIPAACGVMVLSTELVDLILGGGIFDKEAVNITSIILFFFAISIPFESLSHILARSFYALKNTLTPMLINVSSMALMALITYFYSPIYGVKIFSISFTIGFVFYVFLMSVMLKKHLNNFKINTLIKSISKTILASGIMVIVLFISIDLSNFLPEKISHILRIMIGASTFFITAIMLKSEEIESVKYILDRILKKKQNEI